VRDLVARLRTRRMGIARRPLPSVLRSDLREVGRPTLDAVETRPGSRLLDACCGPGYLAGRALARGAVVDGVDMAHTMIELATKLYPAARFQVGDCEEMRYRADTVDAVVCNLGLHHLTSPARGVAEFARVLRPSGRLSLTVWDENRSALDIVPEAIAAAGAIAPYDLPTPPNAPDYDRADELEPLFDAAGLALESVQPITFLQPYPSAQALWDGWPAAAIRTGPLLASLSRRDACDSRSCQDPLWSHVGHERRRTRYHRRRPRVTRVDSEPDEHARSRTRQQQEQQGIDLRLCSVQVRPNLRSSAAEPTSTPGTEFPAIRRVERPSATAPAAVARR
jgi:SAM-dependent methyltransferase